MKTEDKSPTDEEVQAELDQIRTAQPLVPPEPTMAQSFLRWIGRVAIMWLILIAIFFGVWLFVGNDKEDIQTQPTPPVPTKGE
jgi:hypothetical protein